MKALLSEGKFLGSKYSLAAPLAGLPCFLLDKLLPFDDHLYFVSRTNYLILILGLVLMYRVLRPVMDANSRIRLILLIAGGSIFTDANCHFYGESLTAVSVAAGLTLTVFGRRIFGWMLAVIGVVNTPASLAAMGLASLRSVFCSRQIRWLLFPLLAAVLFIMETRIRNNGWLSTGYEGDGSIQTPMPYSTREEFGYPFGFGLLGVLFSFGKGIFFFFPGLLISLIPGMRPTDARLRELLLRWFLFTAGLVLIYSCWWCWWGGWTFGPRFFLFAAFPAALALTGAVRRADQASLWCNLAAAGCIFWQFYTGFCAGVIGDEHLFYLTENGKTLEFMVYYVPEFSVLFSPFRVHFTLSFSQWLFAAFQLTAAAWIALPCLRAAWRAAAPRFRAFLNTACSIRW